MAKKKVADLIVDTLAAAGVERVYGVAGDSLNGITDAIRRQERMQWIHVRHEETAAFAAGYNFPFETGSESMSPSYLSSFFPKTYKIKNAWRPQNSKSGRQAFSISLVPTILARTQFLPYLAPKLRQS